MAVGSRAARRRRWQIVAIVVGIAIVVSAVYGYVAFKRHTASTAIDKGTLCPKAGPRGHVVLLIDRTDPLNEIQSRRFEVLVRDVATKRVPPGGLVSVFALGSDFAENAEPVLEVCNPGSGESVSELDGSPKRRQRDYEQKFVAKVLEESKKIMTPSSEPASPIFEMLQLVAQHFARRDVQGPKHLVIVSDLMHHTKHMSMYRGVPRYASFASTDYGQKARATMPGVIVEAHVVMGKGAAQNNTLAVFWEAHFAAGQARLTEVTALEGLQ
jgi:hypothetical protein